MSLEKKISAYFMAYWPESGPFSIKSMINYAVLEVSFDCTKVSEEHAEFVWSYDEKGTLLINKNVEYVAGNLKAVHMYARKKLVDAGFLVPDNSIKKYCFVKVDNIAKVEEAARQACTKLLLSYLKNGEIAPEKLN